MEIRKHYKISRVFEKKNSKYWEWEDILVGKVLRARVWVPASMQMPGGQSSSPVILRSEFLEQTVWVEELKWQGSGSAERLCLQG